MKRVEKHNPLKKGDLSRKRERLKVSGGRVDIPEITFETVRDDAIQFGLATDVEYQLSAGKEASIFLAHWNGFQIVLKAYRLWHSSHQLSKSQGYSPSGTSKRTYCIYDMIEDCAVLEYDLLMKCIRAGMHVPTPIGRVCNYLTMRFIGDDSIPAPQLKDVDLDSPESALDMILDEYFTMYSDVHYVHGDLSEYNILWWMGRPWIIDVPQAYHVNKHANMQMVEALLRRDIENLLTFFEGFGFYRDSEMIVDIFLEAYVPENMKHYKELESEGVELL